MTTPLIAVAGWAIRPEHGELFPGKGTHLQRYASRFSAVEINSSFYKPHRCATYERWAASVPATFRFAVKMPRLVTHEQRLEGGDAGVARFLDEVTGLGKKLGCILIQLPPSLAYDPRAVETFLAALRRRHAGPVVVEPRHGTWFTGAADARLEAHRIGRVVADPLCDPAGREPGGWPRVAYFRLHGSPVMYHSPYSDAYLEQLAARIWTLPERCELAWCVFDNTARGAAVTDAMKLPQWWPPRRLTG